MSQFLEAEYCYSFIISIVTVTNLDFGHTCISFLLFINFAQSGVFWPTFFQEGMKLVGGKMYAKRKSY